MKDNASKAENEFNLDELQKELERMRVPKGDINYFTATAMLTQEIKHSAFIAWLFNPSKEHKLGSAMIEQFIKRLFRYNNVKNDDVISNRDILRGKDINENSLLDVCKNGEIGVETEVVSITGRRADLCITLTSIYKKEKYLILIENKVFSTTHDDQLSEYETLAKEKYSDYSTIFVYLTPGGELPYNIGGDRKYNDNWCMFDYEELRDIIKGLREDLADKNKYPNLDNKIRAKLKLIMEDYIDMVNDKILVENPDVWDTIRKIRKKYEKELELINKWEDSSVDALRYCHERVKEIFNGRIHFVMGETLENACAFKFYTDEIKSVFDEDDGNFGESTESPRCYIECNGTYCSIQLLVQKRGDWTPRQIKAVETISTFKTLPGGFSKLIFQEYFLRKGERAKKFETLKEDIESRLQTFVNRLEKELKEISSWQFS